MKLSDISKILFNKFMGHKEETEPQWEPPQRTPEDECRMLGHDYVPIESFKLDELLRKHKLLNLGALNDGIIIYPSTKEGSNVIFPTYKKVAILKKSSIYSTISRKAYNWYKDDTISNSVCIRCKECYHGERNTIQYFKERMLEIDKQEKEDSERRKLAQQIWDENCCEEKKD